MSHKKPKKVIQSHPPSDPYSDVEYLDLMDRFKKENIPLSVAVMDMYWSVLPP